MTRWFCSDHHLGHANIIRYSGRPFVDVLHMDELLRTWHNEYVKPEDHVSFLGDVTMNRGGRVQQDAFIREMRRWNGHKRLYLGNHDHFPIQTYLEAGFEKVYGTWRDEQGILFSHFPLHPTSLGSARANVHGHTHRHPSPKPVVSLDEKKQIRVQPYINICVEQTSYRPISLEELLGRIQQAKQVREGA